MTVTMRPALRLVVATAACVTAVAACSSTPTKTPAGTATTSTASAAPTTPTTAATNSVTNVWKGPPTDPTRIPLGDGHRSTTTPAQGSVLYCNQPGGVGGANENGPWIHGSTWDSTTKVAVQGDVTWSQTSYTVTVDGNTRDITTSDLPKGEPTGTFPIAASDPAYQYDRNPNSITAQPATIRLPVNPTPASQPGCLSGGPIGILDDGVYLFDALDGPGRDAVAHETQDRCDGHPAPGGTYHYHDVSSCILEVAKGPSTVVGWAFDGYPIVVERDAAGNLPSDGDLDSCHGRTSPILLDGKVVSEYHYDATIEYPYTLGCFHGQEAAGAAPHG